MSVTSNRAGRSGWPDLALALFAAGLTGLRIGRRGDVAGLLHPLDDLLDQLLEPLLRCLVAVLAEQLLQPLVGQHAAAQQRVEDRVVQRLHRPLVVGAAEVRIAETAGKQQVRQLRHQLVHVELVEQVGDEFAVAILHEPAQSSANAT